MCSSTVFPFRCIGVKNGIMNTGFSLIELMITLFVICFAVLALASAELSALRQTETAYYQSVAATQAASLIERLRANADINEWHNENSRLLPQGKGNYQCNDTTCTVMIYWQRLKQYHLTLLKKI